MPASSERLPRPTTGRRGDPAARTRPRSRIRTIAAAAAAGCLVALGLSAAPAIADPPPAAPDISMRPDGHLMVKWTKEAWQGSNNVKWSSGDGRVDGAWGDGDGSYGYPLEDCQADLRADPLLPGVWNYGEHCRGMDVADEATELVLPDKLDVGTYFVQVTVAGEDHRSGDPCHADASGNGECLTPHFSGITQVRILPSTSPGPGEGTPSGSSAPGPSNGPEPSATDAGGSGQEPRDIVGPQGIDLEGGGRLDVAAGGRVIANGALNFHVTAGSAHLRENLTKFRCPAGYDPFLEGTTLGSWIGARCRTLTTPHAGALVRGTEFSVVVSSEGTTFHVFDGALEVSDLGRHKVVFVVSGQTTTVPAGGVPTDPASFDPRAADRWWDAPPGWLVALVVSLLALIYFLPSLVARRLRRTQFVAVVLVDAFAGWTVVGWLAALGLAFVFRRRVPPTFRPVPPREPVPPETQPPA